MVRKRMRELLFDLVAPPSTPLDAKVSHRLTQGVEWTGLCSILSRCGLSALAYQHLVRAGIVVPQSIAAWLRTQYHYTLKRNLFLREELHVVTSHLIREGIPTLVMKGPVLARIGVGDLVRPYRDLDLVVERRDITRAAESLRSMGFVEIQRPPHRFHQTFVLHRREPERSTTVELHFDFIDTSSPYIPDAASIWSRSINLQILGRVVRCPELTDHLLLTIMQLPHHHWSPRLLVDIGHIVHASDTTINWEQFIQRAVAWQMRALAGSALYCAASLLQVRLPKEAGAFADPEGYVERIQWRIARQAALDHLAPCDTRTVGPLAPFLLVDHFRSIWPLMQQRVLRRSEQEGQLDQGVAAAIPKRVMAGLSSLPSLMSVAARATTNDSFKIL